MRERCRNRHRREWPRYGGRGITVDQRFDNFADFLAYMGPCPEGASLDRIDNDGNYAPGNVRWASVHQQMTNRSDNRSLTLNGKTQTLKDWSNETGIRVATIWARLKNGWAIAAALTSAPMTSAEAGQLGAAQRWHS